MALQLTQITAEQVAKKYAELLSSVLNLRHVFLFGSHAKGTADEDSDIDIAVVSDDFTGDKVDDIFKLMKLRREIDIRIEPHAFLSDDFSTENPDSFVSEILKTGIKIS